MSKNPAPDRITLSFDLLDLPTAQHRAGLAGLILQIDSMGEGGNRRPKKLTPEIEEVTTTTATVTFTRDSMQGVFDDLYAAKLVEVVVANKWPGEAKPKDGEFHVSKKDPKTGELKQARGFAYDVVQPQSPCLSSHLKLGSKDPWLDLWRQMVWTIPRGGNNVRSRAPFNDRAAGKPCGDGATAWTQVVDFHEKHARSRFPIAPISGALMLGAQAVNAENVPFSGRVDHNLLLHFWQVVVMTFVPQVVSRKDAKIERDGYVLAIPDVADLREFRYSFPRIIGHLEGDPGRTPAGAKIDLPDQACLELLRRLKDEAEQETKKLGATGPARSRADRFEARLARETGDRGAQKALVEGKAGRSFGDCVRAVESYHMSKVGNNVKILSFARVADRPGLVEDYANIARSYRNPLFRAALMRALIRGRPWYSGMTELFAEYPWPFFVSADETPKYLPRFGRDGLGKFLALRKDTHQGSFQEMDDEQRLQHLSLVIQRLVIKYVEGRAESKTGKKVKDFPRRTVDGKVRRVYPNEFREAQQRVCSDAFLAMRSRHDQDFVEFFAGSVCSVAQFLTPADYQFLTGVLMTRPDPSPLGRGRISWEDVKAVAMIAVSACSYNVRPRDADAQGSPS